MALPLTVILLAGGASRRMGRDKALLRIRGKRAVDLMVEHYGKLGRRVLVASGNRCIRRLRVPQITDPAGTRGPLGGLQAGMEASRASWVLLAACDQAPLSAELLKRLWKRRQGAKAVPLSGSPLPGLYHRSLLPRIRHLRLQGRGPSALPSRKLDAPIPPSWNTPHELASFRTGSGQAFR